MPDLRVQNWHGREVVPESGLNKDTLKEVRDERKLATEEGYPNYARQVREYHGEGVYLSDIHPKPDSTACRIA